MGFSRGSLAVRLSSLFRLDGEIIRAPISGNAQTRLSSARQGDTQMIVNFFLFFEISLLALHITENKTFHLPIQPPSTQITSPAT